MDVTRFPVHDATAQGLAAIADPLARFKASAKLAAEARRKVIGVPPRPRHPEDLGEPSEVIVQRNEALCVLHLNHGYAKQVLARRINCDRRTLNTGFDTLRADLMDEPEDQLWAVARRCQKEWLEWASIWRTATDVRDELIRLLTDSATAPGGRVYENAELVRLSEAAMSSSMVAQVRRQSANAWKKAHPDEARRRKKERLQARKAGTRRKARATTRGGKAAA